MSQLVTDITIAGLAITFLLLTLIYWTVRYEFSIKKQVKKWRGYD
ncbi:MAG TPA: hypothetical protein VMW45_03775 [Dehalococcoidia bacterium]|nr:hypothetical protein [Dehalococcoidia bacterium]